jgi:protein-S-isoprenylcysteine O-methyltransferase Ste14
LEANIMTQSVILHGERGNLSEGPRIFFMVNQVLAVALSGWFLLGSGYATIDRWFHLGWQAGNRLRRIFLFVCSIVYMLRLTFNLFYTLRRRIGWSEAWGNSLVMYVLHFVLDVLGGRATAAPGPADAAAGALFVAGSAITTGSEAARHQWKQQPRHQGRLYTEGLNRWTQHPNYLGEVISWGGYAWLAHYAAAALVPLSMLAGFIFYNIPLLNAYLARHYGEAFAAYAARTKKLIPFIY